MQPSISRWSCDAIKLPRWTTWWPYPEVDWNSVVHSSGRMCNLIRCSLKQRRRFGGFKTNLGKTRWWLQTGVLSILMIFETQEDRRLCFSSKSIFLLLLFLCTAYKDAVVSTAPHRFHICSYNNPDAFLLSEVVVDLRLAANSNYKWRSW